MPAKKSSRRSKKQKLIKPAAVNGVQDAAAAGAMSPDLTKQQAAKKAKPPKAVKVVHPKAPMTFRRNVLPPLLGILMFVGILGLLNGQWLVAQYQYRFKASAADSSTSLAPASTDVNAPARMYIPKINVDAPVVTDMRSYDPGAVQSALQRGVVQYGVTANPGQKGNVVMAGHSSGQLWAPGEYKFVFTMLDKLVRDDRIIVDYKGTRYIYRVDSTRVVPPTDLTVLQQTEEPQLTLITCTPVGTNKNRLIVTARQVSPAPDTATPLQPEQLRGDAPMTTLPN